MTEEVYEKEAGAQIAKDIWERHNTLSQPRIGLKYSRGQHKLLKLISDVWKGLEVAGFIGGFLYA